VQFGLLQSARASLHAWLRCRGGSLEDYPFPSRSNHARHIGATQYARLVDEWVYGIGLRPEDYGTHSLRRTKASIICQETGNLRAIQLLLGHAKIESTVRYLGQDALRFTHDEWMVRLYGNDPPADVFPDYARRVFSPMEEVWTRIEQRNHQPGNLFISKNTFDLLKQRFHPLDPAEERIVVPEHSYPMT
jgi:hypothetical protein